MMDPVVIWSGSGKAHLSFEQYKRRRRRTQSHLSWQEAQVTETEGLMKGLEDGRDRAVL